MIPSDWGKPPEQGEAFWLLGLFMVAVGLPFLAVSANGPLLQAWFARSGHTQARDPYFLYSASNTGSFVVLLLYPLALEPFLTLREQTVWWMGGFVALAGLISACGLWIAQVEAKRQDTISSVEDVKRAVGWRNRLAWMCLSFIPSGLLVSVTAHISTDIAAVPLLWVVPLALFLLTFVLSFRDKALVSLPTLVRLQVWSTALALFSLGLPLPLWLNLAVHLITFFVSALLCHTALYTRRPLPDHLTEFYLFISLGGVLGGAFCGLLSPRLFSTILEYPMLLAAALFCRPEFFAGHRNEWVRDAGRIVLVSIGVAAAGYLLTIALPSNVLPSVLVRSGVLAFFALAMAIDWQRPRQLAPGVVGMVLISAGLHFGIKGTETVRSFFGVHKLTTTDDGRFLTLYHGTTLHGAMRLRNDDGTLALGRPEPTTYYSYDGAIGSTIVSVRKAHNGVLPSVAVIGLGSGSLACHAAVGEAWTFLEIDPQVVQIAKDRRYFRFLEECAPSAKVVLGDARLTLADQRSGMSLIIVDAFSSDAIPSHLLTTQAIALYRSKLDPTGAILIHISNRHLELRHILARAAAEHNLTAYVLSDLSAEPVRQRYRTGSRIVVLTRDPEHLGPIAQNRTLERLNPEMTRRPWTDDFSNIVEAILDQNGS